MNRLSGLDIYLSSCSIMSDSCSDVFACSKIWWLKLMQLVLWSKCVTHLIKLEGGGGGGGFTNPVCYVHTVSSRT